MNHISDKEFFKQFYYVGSSWATQYYRFSTLESEEDIQDDFELFRGEFTPKKPITIKIDRGGRAADFIWGGRVSVKIVSDKVVNILRENKIKKFTTYPVNVMLKNGEKLEGFHGLSVLGRAGPIDLVRSRAEVTFSDNGSAFPLSLNGLFFHPENWDGSDIFTLDKTCDMLITRRLLNLFKKNKVRGFKAISLKHHCY